MGRDKEEGEEEIGEAEEDGRAGQRGEEMEVEVWEEVWGVGKRVQRKRDDKGRFL